MDNKLKPKHEINTAEQREAFKQMLLGLLDDPQIQHKIGAILGRSNPVISTRMNVPQRWYR